MKNWIRVVTLIGSCVALLGCGSSSAAPDLGGNLVTNGTFSAAINGKAWSAIGRVGVSRPTANTIGIMAVSTTYAMRMELYGVPGPGTYGVGSNTTTGSQILVSTTTGSAWVSNNTGGTGSVTFTTLTPTHVAGTFSFDAPPTSTQTIGTLHVTSGSFDVTY